MGRSSDQALHVVWKTERGVDEFYRHVRISPNGIIGAVDDVFPTSADALSVDPKLVRNGSGLELVFTRLPEGTFLTSTAPAAGTPWSDPVVLGDEERDIGQYGIGAGRLADDRLVASTALNDALYWHVEGETITSTLVLPGHSIIGQNLAVDRVTGQAWSAYYNQGSANGVWAVPLEPSVGTPRLAPGSVDADGNSLAPDQQVAIAAPRDGGVFAAYCVGYPTCTRARIWRLGSTRVLNVPRSRGVEEIALAPGENGRMWLVWYREPTRHLYAARTNADGTAIGRPLDLGRPGGDDTFVFGISVNGAVDRADITVVTSDASNRQQVWYGRALPTLKIRATPRRWDGDAVQRVRFTVTDAGDPVRGARVRAAGEVCRTNRAGRCTLTIGPMDAGRIRARAAKAGYAPGIIGLRVLP